MSDQVEACLILIGYMAGCTTLFVGLCHLSDWLWGV